MGNPFLDLYNFVVYSEHYTDKQKKEFIRAWKLCFQYEIEFTAGDWLTVLPIDYFRGESNENN